MTIEWVLEQKYAKVLRLDLVRRTYSRSSANEGVDAALFFYNGDEEGSFLGYLRYQASESGGGHIEFEYSGIQSEWSTMVGDIIAHWPAEWRVTSINLCRLGIWDRERDRMCWETLTPGHLLVTQHLARMWGAVEQFSVSKNPDARFVLGSATGGLRTQVARCNDAIRSLTRQL
ncbi:hypothetical protein KY386_00235 [Candidatus Parcubacteria bacterium]|nr:hypothetical protein [Candidatus Parcubacteria bacterium]